MRKFGWLVDRIDGISSITLRARLLAEARTQRSVAIPGPKAPPKAVIGYQSEWNVRANVSESDLAGSARLTKRQHAQKGAVRMLITTPPAQRYSAQSGLRDIMLAEKEIILAFVLQLMGEHDAATLARCGWKLEALLGTGRRG